MNKDQLTNVVLNALSGTLAAITVGIVNEALKGKTIGGKKVVLFTANAK